jgi:hypothetical protein
MLIFIVNMAFAWSVVNRTVDSIDTQLMSGGVLIPENGVSIGHMNEAAPNTMAYMGKLAEVHVLLKAASNMQMIQVVAMACAFGLLAIGFALFVMGIESAFDMNIQSQALGKVVISATAPGLACFVLVALIIGITIATRGEMKLEPMSLNYGYHGGYLPTGNLPPKVEEELSKPDASELDELNEFYRNTTAGAAEGDES